MKTPPPLPSVERRFHTGVVEIRSADGQPSKVRGYAAVFGKRSSNLGSEDYQFFEIINRGAFDDVLKDDVRALFNHDPNFILARSRDGAGTLSIGSDETGLWYEFTPPDTNAGRDLAESLKRGDVDQSSFAFTLTSEGQKWEETREGDKTVVVRTISKVARLYDVSPVTYPAYPDASVALRSHEEFVAAQKPSAPALESFTQTGARAARFGLR
jgi:HK97 family phage prohead protease